MRRLWFRRKAQATIIAGIVMLVIFLVAVVSMVIISQQNDNYELAANKMEQKMIDMYSENLLGAYPGVYNGTQKNGFGLLVLPCGGTNCYVYTILVNNFGISAQIARIYINTTSTAPSGTPCSTPCVLDPKSSATPYSFNSSTAVVNTGEFYHNVVIWLPQTAHGLPATCGSSNSACNTIEIVTTRGRVFLFLWPFQPLNQSAKGGHGGTGIYIGPLVITFERMLITYTSSSQKDPPLPIMTPNPSGSGPAIPYWSIPRDKIIIYVKIQTDVNVTHDVYLTAQSVFEVAQYTSPGAITPFFIIAPISQQFCESGWNPGGTNGHDSSIECSLYPPTGNEGDPGAIKEYEACNVPPQQYNSANCASQGARYMIPKPDPAVKNSKGKPVVVAFGSNALTPSTNPQSVPSGWDGHSVTSYLGLSFVYDNGEGAYVYGVTLPFIAMCVGSCRI
jgi:hypothetical protein